MVKRHIAIILILALLLTGSGCASMLEKEYLVISEYEDNSTDEQEDSRGGINDYYSLKREIVALVENHEEYGQLKFNNYSGNVSDDLSKACWDVKANTALGAYSIDYISYDLSQIVSYYEADIYITYKRSREEVEAIVNVSSISMARECIEEAMAAYEGYLCIKMTTIINNTDTIRQNVQDLYYANPLKFAVLPEMQVSMYPDNGIEKIFEFSFDYSFEPEELTAMKDKLIMTVSDYALGIDGDSPQYQVIGISSLLADECQYIPELSDDTESQNGEKNLGNTAYGALVEKTADSEGMAMAFLALCMAEEIECRVVRGRMDNIEHVWNMVRLGDHFYHVDVSQIKSRGMEDSILLSDEKLWGNYWWDKAAYPSCEGDLNYYEIMAAQQ
ncbi:MAG TPA: transglutaminase domain-containing protein [Clostridiales bacterium]|nr:transglutaminase domain-containing protein [Clostridiales bacterium]